MSFTGIGAFDGRVFTAEPSRRSLDEKLWPEPDRRVRFLQQTRMRPGVHAASELMELAKHHGITYLDHCGDPRHFRHCRDLSPPDPVGRYLHRRGNAGCFRCYEPLHLSPRTAWYRPHAEFSITRPGVWVGSRLIGSVAGNGPTIAWSLVTGYSRWEIIGLRQGFKERRSPVVVELAEH